MNISRCGVSPDRVGLTQCPSCICRFVVRQCRGDADRARLGRPRELLPGRDGVEFREDERPGARPGWARHATSLEPTGALRIE